MNLELLLLEKSLNSNHSYEEGSGDGSGYGFFGNGDGSDYGYGDSFGNGWGDGKIIVEIEKNKDLVEPIFTDHVTLIAVIPSNSFPVHKSLYNCPSNKLPLYLNTSIKELKDIILNRLKNIKPQYEKGTE